MTKILLLNGSHPQPFSSGKLSEAFLDRAKGFFIKNGCDVLLSASAGEWNAEEEVEKHLAADFIIVQMPVHWMGTPWSLKKYIDHVYMAGIGRIWASDGRTTENPTKGYGTGGLLHGKKYMLSVTFNAPSEAFGDKSEYLFQGRSVDDLLLPLHMNFRFIGMGSLSTFAAFDVVKNLDSEKSFKLFDEHLSKNFLFV